MEASAATNERPGGNAGLKVRETVAEVPEDELKGGDVGSAGTKDEVKAGELEAERPLNAGGSYDVAGRCAAHHWWARSSVQSPAIGSSPSRRASSFADWGRSPGFLARHASTSSSSSRGIGRSVRVDGRAGRSLACFSSSPTMFSAVKTSWPVRSQ